MLLKIGWNTAPNNANAEPTGSISGKVKRQKPEIRAKKVGSDCR